MPYVRRHRRSFAQHQTCQQKLDRQENVPPEERRRREHLRCQQQQRQKQVTYQHKPTML